MTIIKLSKDKFNCERCEDGHNLIRGFECFHCGNNKVKYFKKLKGGLKKDDRK